MSGTNHGSGHTPFTKLGNDLQGQQHRLETTDPEVAKIYKGWLKDIRLPFGTTDVKSDRLPGTWVKIFFDKPSIEKVWGKTWFKLAENPAELLQNYGTADSIRNTKIRLNITIRGMSVRRGIVRIVGDTQHENTHRGYEETPVKCYADIIYGISSGTLPS